MELNLGFFDFAVIFFASGGVIFNLLVASALWRLNGSRWLLLLLLAVAAFLASQIISFGGFHQVSAAFYYPPLRFTFAFGPLLYFYALSRTAPERGWQRWDTLHFLLPATQALLQLWLGVQSIEMKHWFWVTLDQPWYGVFDDVWTGVSLIVYGVLIWQLLTRPALGRATAVLPARQQTILRWFGWLLIGSGVLAFAIDQLVPRLLQLLAVNPFAWPAYASLPVIAYSLMSLAIGLLVMAIYWPRQTPEPAGHKETYGITPELLEDYSRRLQTLMEREAPYLDPDLTLTKLAARLDLPARHLSYVINASQQKSFAEFINQYRIEHVQQLLADPSHSHRPILDLALAAGFRSKSTFNRIFRELTGSTPSQMRANGRS